MCNGRRKTGHEHFHEFDNSQLCFYDISEIAPSRRDERIGQLVKNRHHAMHTSDHDKAVAFETD